MREFILALRGYDDRERLPGEGGPRSGRVLRLAVPFPIEEEVLGAFGETLGDDLGEHVG